MKLPVKRTRKKTHIRFTKVKHTGCHQDYRIYFHDVHVGNVRAGFHVRGVWNWSARTDVNGKQIRLSAERGVSRVKLAQDLIACMQALGYGNEDEPVPFMQITRDVGAQESE